jgi:hypothetical protein
MRDQSKGKEGKIVGYFVLYTVKLRNDLVPDPDRLPDVTKKHFTEHMMDFVAYPWLEVQGGDLDGEHSEILTHALTALVRLEDLSRHTPRVSDVEDGYDEDMAR